jgi:hypothetical protein
MNEARPPKAAEAIQPGGADASRSVAAPVRPDSGIGALTDFFRYLPSRDAELRDYTPSSRATPGSKSPGGGDPEERRAPYGLLDRHVALWAPRDDGVDVQLSGPDLARLGSCFFRLIRR